MKELPHYFRRPDELLVSQLMRILPILPILPKHVLTSIGMRRGNSSLDSLDRVVEALMTSLIEDYKENASEADAPWTFDYVVDWVDVEVDRETFRGLNVSTRLKPKDHSESGNVLYGRSVFRADPETYACWL